MQALAQWAVLHHALVLSQASTNSLHHASCANGFHSAQALNAVDHRSYQGATAAKGSLLIKAIQLRYLSEGITLPWLPM